MTEFEHIVSDIEKATSPHEIFGPVAEDHARKMWLCMLKIIHPGIQPRRRYRPANAVVAAQEFREVQKQVFGDRKFVELIMP